ncbi:polysaccharide biosynthesis tyrosine autokinase [Thermodesulfobacteriota bacterium]
MKLKQTIQKQKSMDLSELFLGNYPDHSFYSESYRMLRTGIQFSFLDEEYRSILITSAGAEEGKTASTANLAYTFAQAGKTALMIDADLRKPRLSSIVETTDRSGLSELLGDTFSADVRSGSLAEFSVSDLFHLLKFQKRTGLLDLAAGQEKINLYFLNGDLADVQWPTRPKKKRLATQLVNSNVLTRKQAEQALSQGRNTGQKLGFTLINMGLVTAEDLTGIITLHMLEGLRTAMQIKSGTFSFENLPDSNFEQSAFNPVDLPQTYRQAVVGHEEFLYLKNEIEASIIPTDTENLFLLPSGPRPPKPAELLGSERMSFLLSYLNRRYDIVVIDSPPVLLASDALLIAPQVDGVLLIVKYGLINRQTIKKSIEQLRRAQANIIGVALNQVDIKKDGQYKYYAKYYHESE